MEICGFYVLRSSEPSAGTSITHSREPARGMELNGCCRWKLRGPTCTSRLQSLHFVAPLNRSSGSCVPHGRTRDGSTWPPPFTVVASAALDKRRWSRRVALAATSIKGGALQCITRRRLPPIPTDMLHCRNSRQQAFTRPTTSFKYNWVRANVPYEITFTCGLSDYLRFRC